MSGNKTVANSASAFEFMDGLENRQQADDSRELVKMMQEVSGEPPVMWGGAIIGFGTFHYRYVSGREGDWPLLAFSPRKGKTALYITFDAEKLTSEFPNLGKFTTSKGCIYIKRLSDVNLEELRSMIVRAYEAGYESPERADGKEQLA